MNKIKIISLLVCLSLSLVFSTFAQKAKETPIPQNLMKRSTTRTEKYPLSAGGTLTLIGAPKGAVSIEGWNKNEVEVTAEIEWQGASEADLELLSKINTFTVQDDLNHIRILTTGTHDKEFMKRAGKKFPKNLLNLPWKIDYKVRVPTFCDLDITVGEGAFSLKSVEGTMIINAIKSNADLILSGGAVVATFGEGNVNVQFTTRSWRGRGAEIQVASGDLHVNMMPNFNADLTASILRNGKIENQFPALQPRDRTKFSEKSMIARTGGGGARLSFSVGDGTLFLSENPK